LVRAHRPVIAIWAIHHIGQSGLIVSPEALGERLAHTVCLGCVLPRRISVPCGQECGERSKGVVSKRVELNRFAGARRHHMVSDPGIHPRELDPWLARMEEAVSRIDANRVARARYVTRNDVANDR